MQPDAIWRRTPTQGRRCRRLVAGQRAAGRPCWEDATRPATGAIKLVIGGGGGCGKPRANRETASRDPRPRQTTFRGNFIPPLRPPPPPSPRTFYSSHCPHPRQPASPAFPAAVSAYISLCFVCRRLVDTGGGGDPHGWTGVRDYRMCTDLDLWSSEPASVGGAADWTSATARIDSGHNFRVHGVTMKSFYLRWLDAVVIL